MARQSREKEDYGVYHIMQTGGDSRNLFTGNGDRDEFVRILKKARLKFGFKLYAYCVARENEYHLVVNTNASDISSIMRSINISYALYAKCGGKLFKDRYRSSLVENYAAMLGLVSSIFNESTGNAIWNEYCKYSGIEIDLDSSCESEAEKGVIIKTVPQAIQKVIDMANERNMTFADMVNDKRVRNETIFYMRHNSSLSMREIGEIMGGISESAVCKILGSCS
jgi:putative transposase